MSALVETMAYTGEAPWHGLGNKVDDNLTLEQFIVAAGLDWRVNKVQLYAPHQSEKRAVKAPGLFAVQRVTDGRIFGACGKAYKPAQNSQVAEFYREFIKAGDMKMDTAGSLKDGEMVWFLARMDMDIVLPGNDRLKSYVLIGVPHKPGKSVVIKFVSMRVVCNNTLTVALGENGSEYRHTHRSAFTEATIEEAKEVLGLARETVQLSGAQFQALANTSVTNREMASLMGEFFNSDEPEKVGTLFVKGKEGFGWDDFNEAANRGTKNAIKSYFKAPGATPGSL